MRALLIILLITFFAGCSKQVDNSEKAIRPIAWVQVNETDLTQLRTLAGIVAPIETANLSFEVAGKIQSVDAKLGDSVTKGQLLSKLDQRNFSLNLQSAQAQLDKANASLVDATSTYQRFSKLINQKLVSQSEFDNAKAAYDSSRSAVAVAQAQYDIANKNLLDSKLLAPYNGIITKRLIEPSQQIATGQAAFEIEGDHGLEVNVLVPETLIRELKPNSPLSIRFPVLANVTIKGVISEIGTRAESANAFPVTVILSESDERLRAGMSAEVDFVFNGEGRTGYKGKTIGVPLSALRAGLNQKSYVFVYDEKEGVVHQREVQTENILENKVFISHGLKDNEIIAIAGVAFLRDGQQVTLLDNSIQRFN